MLGMEETLNLGSEVRASLDAPVELEPGIDSYGDETSRWDVGGYVIETTEYGYSSLTHADGWSCTLTEPEDRMWWRDLKPVIERLTALAGGQA